MNKRVFGLDVMRCIAILTVMYLHAFSLLPMGVNPMSKMILLQSIDGVDIFFALSGFLIGTILFQKIDENSSAKTLLLFWRDRWLRTLPAYFFVLAVLFCLTVKWVGVKYFIPYLFFLQTLHSAKILFAESWSLSVEEWFYLCTPILFFLASRFKTKKTLQLLSIIAVIVLGNAIRIYKSNHYAITDMMDYNFAVRAVLPARMDAIMYGVLAAYLSHYRNSFWLRNKNLLFYTGVIGFFITHVLSVFMHFPNSFVTYLYFPLTGFFIMMVLPKTASVKQGKGWIAKLITHISKTSYSIYLVHTTFFLFFIRPLFPDRLIIQLPAYLLWAFGASYLLYATVEKAGLRIRERMRRRQQEQAAANKRERMENLAPSWGFAEAPKEKS